MSFLGIELTESLPSFLTPTSFIPSLPASSNALYLQNYTPKIPSIVDDNQHKLDNLLQSNYSPSLKFQQLHQTIKNGLEVNDQWRVDHSSGLITASLTDNANKLPEEDGEFDELGKIFHDLDRLQTEQPIQEHVEEENGKSTVGYLTDKVQFDYPPAYLTTSFYQQKSQHHSPTGTETVYQEVHEERPSLDQGHLQISPEAREHLLSHSTDQVRLITPPLVHLHRERSSSSSNPTSHQQYSEKELLRKIKNTVYQNLYEERPSIDQGHLQTYREVQVRPATLPHTRPNRKRNTSSSGSTSHQQYTEEELMRRRKNTESYKKSIAKKKRVQKETEMLLVKVKKENIALKKRENHLITTMVKELKDLHHASCNCKKFQKGCINLAISNYLAKNGLIVCPILLLNNSKNI